MQTGRRSENGICRDCRVWKDIVIRRNVAKLYFKILWGKPKKPCEDCGNCLREFETLDMTDAAKKIINCVYEARGRYGKSIIMDTVLGAKTARLEEVGAIHYKSYGALSDANKKLLRQAH